MHHLHVPLLLLILCSGLAPAYAEPGGGQEPAKGTATADSDAVKAEPPQPEKLIPLPVGVKAPSATRLCSPDNPRIGTEVTCLVSVEHPKAFSVSVGVPPSFSAAEQIVAPMPQEPDLLRTTRQVSITPMSMRKLKLFGFSITWSHQSGAKGTVILKDEYMAMSSMMGGVDEPEFRTFRTAKAGFDRFWTRHGVLPLIETNWYLMVGLIIVVLGGLLSFIILYVQRLRAQRREAEKPWVDPRPAHVIANESLELLAAETLPEQGLILEFYLRLSEILRVFLENRFGIAVERGRGVDGEATGLRFTAATTEEIEAALTGQEHISADGFKALMECLGVIDYVVFGGIRPHAGQTEADRRRIRFCIDLNKVVEAVTSSDSDHTHSVTPRGMNSGIDEAQLVGGDESESGLETAPKSQPILEEIQGSTTSQETFRDRGEDR